MTRGTAPKTPMSVAPLPANATPADWELASFAPLSSRRLLVLGGIALILVGMIFGDIFAVFILHQNASRVGTSLAAAAHAALAGNSPAVLVYFQNVGGFLENRGTKVDTHVHMISFGYLALMLAVLQPWVAFSQSAKKAIAWIFLVGAAVLPVGVFLIHYVGLAYSPLKTIGWASTVADFGGLLVLLSTGAFLVGLCRHRQASRTVVSDMLLADRSAAGRLLLAGGLALVLLGFLHGTYYAAVDLYEYEARDYSLLLQMSSGAAAGDVAAVDSALAGYGQLQGEKAVNIAAHAHSIEFGLLAMLLAFFQPYVGLSAAWKRRWAAILLLGSLLLPVFVLLELQYGLLAGGVADFGGLLVIVALLAMWIGILRYTGSLDAPRTAVEFRSVLR
jgi:heme/copper-type cytochrome/quinol oxidase subunit 4